MSSASQNDLPPIKYLGVGHQSQDIHIGANGERSKPEHGGASVYTALTAWLLTGERAAVVAATGPDARSGSSAGIDSGTLETSVDPDGEQTIFEDWVEGDSRRQRLLSGAPAIDESLGAIGQRGRNASIVFACPLLDELPLDCRSWFWSEFVCLVPQGWFRDVAADGSITLLAPEVSEITGPWDLVVLSEEEAEAAGDLAGWRQLAQVLAVTRGSRGATIFYEGGEHEIAAVEPPAVVDTTGAGDVWAAAFAVRFSETHSVEQAGRFASTAAAICVSRVGLKGVPESRHEVEALLAAQSGGR